MYKATVVTGSRAEYGLLRPLINRLKSSKIFDLSIYVTGSHLHERFGNTVTELIEDGQEFIPIYIDIGDTPTDVARSLGQCVTQIAAAWDIQRPDFVILLGDRYEIFAAAQAALIKDIPVVHIHGGEVTEGSFDDAIRHCITKIARVHFTANEIYRMRVLQLGEDPNYVFTTGALASENIVSMPRIKKKELERILNFRFRKNNILITLHPVTAGDYHVSEVDYLIKALSKLGSDVGLILTGSNADPGAESIEHKLKKFSATQGNSVYIPNLGAKKYLSVMAITDGLVGNSSSAIYEAPLMDKWSINIGPRQHGRVKPPSVHDIEATGDISGMINKLINMKKPMIENNQKERDPVSLKMIKILEDIDFKSFKAKRFKDY